MVLITIQCDGELFLSSSCRMRPTTRMCLTEPSSCWICTNMRRASTRPSRPLRMCSMRPTTTPSRRLSSPALLRRCVSLFPEQHFLSLHTNTASRARNRQLRNLHVCVHMWGPCLTLSWAECNGSLFHRSLLCVSILQFRQLKCIIITEICDAAQLINVINRRPLLDLSMTYFAESYSAEITKLGLQGNLLRDVLMGQILEERMYRNSTVIRNHTIPSHGDCTTSLPT